MKGKPDAREVPTTQTPSPIDTSFSKELSVWVESARVRAHRTMFARAGPSSEVVMGTVSQGSEHAVNLNAAASFQAPVTIAIVHPCNRRAVKRRSAPATGVRGVVR
jgi:hypothetical protein